METTLYIEKMDCPTEEQLIRSRLMNFEGIEKLDFDLVRRELTVSHRLADTKPLLAALKGTGMDAEQVGPSPNGSPESDAGAAWMRQPVVSRADWVQLTLAGALALAAEIVARATGAESSLLVAGLALAAIALGGREMLVKGWRVVRAFSLGINFLMTIAVTGAVAGAVAGAVIIGVWPEAAMVTVLFALALVGVATLWMAVFADMGASLLVTFNGLPLLRTRHED